MASSIYPLLIILVPICALTTTTQVKSASVLSEDGYTVSTILDGNKHQINPHSILPLYGSSDLIVLDTSGSTFYTLSLANPEEKMVKKLAGSGVPGYVDGELDSAVFNKPNSFAVDYNGNLYVADRLNHAIRKISKSVFLNDNNNLGVTTIAGGYSQKPGKRDGPALNASFSDEFELVFVPKLCAVIISDHGNKLVRQINLKAEDCSFGSHSVMGQVSAWALGLGLSCLLGLIIGFVLRPYVMSRGGLILISYNKTWKHCLTSLGRQLLMICFDMKNAVVRSIIYVTLRKFIFLSLSTLSLMFRIKSAETPACEKPVSLLDIDHLRNNDRAAESHFGQLKDLLCFGEAMGIQENIQLKDADNEKTDSSAGCSSILDTLIEANITGFAAESNETLLAEHLEGNSRLVRRR